MRQKITPEQVTEGMYLLGFGGSWLDHPFWRVKFVLKNSQQVERVRQSGVPYVLIDDERGVGVAPEASGLPAPPAPESWSSMLRKAHKPVRRPIAAIGDLDAASSSDRKRAGALVLRSMRTMKYVFDGARLGRAVRMESVVSIVDEVSASVERSPRAILDVIRLKKKDEYTYLHSVAVCTLMVNAARHMGLGLAETREFGLAGLLHDIGKMGVADDILQKPAKLTDMEFQSVRNHPELGYRMLRETPGICETALDVCRHHHEKIDGTGYPHGQSGDAISLAARLGAVCDVYDAVTSDRAYKQAWSPMEGITAMWNWEGHFDRDILFAFMQSIGIFPEGLLVQLRSNRLGIVLKNKRRNSRTSVLAFYSTRDREFIEPETVVIKDSLANDSVIAPADPEEWGFHDWEVLAKDLVEGRGANRPMAMRAFG